MEVNQRAIDLIKKWEGFRATAYRDPVGILTIGYGTTAAAGVGIDPKPGMTITEAEAEIYLMRAVEKFADQIRPMIKVPVNENEFGALVSLAYNIGPGAFEKSTLLRKLNAGDRQGAADQFSVWRMAGGKVLKGLENRRAEERGLFLMPVAARPQAPAPDTPAAPAKNAAPAAALVAAAVIGAVLYFVFGG